MLKEWFALVKTRFRKKEAGFELPEKPAPLLSTEGKKRAVVLEYYQAVRARYADWLGKNGLAYFITHDEEEFFKELDNASVIVIDDHQPEINGFRLASKIKAERQVPIMVTSAEGSLEAYHEFQTSRADVFVIKPIPLEKFLDGLSQLLDKEMPLPEKIPAKRGRKPLSFLDLAEKTCQAFQDSGLSKAEFARKNKLSLSSLKTEFRIVALPLEAKRVIRANIGAFKKSFIEHICRLEHENNIVALCQEIAEQSRNGRYCDLAQLRKKISDYKIA